MSNLSKYLIFLAVCALIIAMSFEKREAFKYPNFNADVKADVQDFKEKAESQNIRIAQPLYRRGYLEFPAFRSTTGVTNGIVKSNRIPQYQEFVVKNIDINTILTTGVGLNTSTGQVRYFITWNDNLVWNYIRAIQAQRPNLIGILESDFDTDIIIPPGSRLYVGIDLSLTLGAGSAANILGNLVINGYFRPSILDYQEDKNLIYNDIFNVWFASRL
jgi:hypothetical protein